MRPFNLKEYLKDPSKKVVTRDGRDARIICTDRLGKVYPVVALWTDEDLDGNTYERIDSYTKDGKYNAGLEYERDLFFDTVKKEGWINIYKGYSDGSVYESEEDAKKSTTKLEKPYYNNQNRVGGIMELKDYTTEELRAELKRRYAEEKAKKASILRCRMCKHWGKISYWGRPIDYIIGGNNLPCKFFKTKNGKYYRCHRASQLACEHFERKEE